MNEEADKKMTARKYAEELFIKTFTGSMVTLEDQENIVSSYVEAYSLGQSHMREKAGKLVKQRLKEFDESENLNDEEKGLVRWGIENVEIGLEELQAIGEVE